MLVVLFFFFFKQKISDIITVCTQAELLSLCKLNVNSVLQDLVRDLQIAKQQTWAEKEKASSRYEEERKINLANKVWRFSFFLWPSLLSLGNQTWF